MCVQEKDAWGMCERGRDTSTIDYHKIYHKYSAEFEHLHYDVVIPAPHSGTSQLAVAGDLIAPVSDVLLEIPPLDHYRPLQTLLGDAMLYVLPLAALGSQRHRPPTLH